MRLFWWQQLPLLLVLQILLEVSANHKLCAEALLACKSTIGNPRHASGRIGRFSCQRQKFSDRCYKLKDSFVASLISGIFPTFLQTRLAKLTSLVTNFFPSNTPIHLQEELHGSRNRRITTSLDRDNNIPTFTPLQGANIKKSSKQKFAAIVGGVAAAVLVLAILVLVYICLMRVKRRFVRRTSEAASSVPSPAELERGITSPYAGAISPHIRKNLRQLTIMELEYATCNFSQSNIIGEGAFGLAYKGLLQDGSIVAVKRRVYYPCQGFIHEVNNIARVHHKHLVGLVGYCEDGNQQFLVYDYISHGNVGNHLYGGDGLPIGKLDMGQRLLIALGAAAGLEHLHGLVPPFLHMHFRTSNVLVDENFTAKVSDYGLSKLVNEGHRAGSSSRMDSFLDPELKSWKNFSARSDAYSFGVFLLELISGREAHCRVDSNSDQNLVLQAKESRGLENLIDKALRDLDKSAAKEMMKLALHCVDVSHRRPSMRSIVEELERIRNSQIGALSSKYSEDIGFVTLGSELFK